MAMHESANLPILFKGVAEVVDYMGVAQGLQHPGLMPKVRLLRAIVCCQYLDCHQQPLPPRLVHLQSRGDSGARALCSEDRSSSSVSSAITTRHFRLTDSLASRSAIALVRIWQLQVEDTPQ